VAATLATSIQNCCALCGCLEGLGCCCCACGAVSWCGVAVGACRLAQRLCSGAGCSCCGCQCVEGEPPPPLPLLGAQAGLPKVALLLHSAPGVNSGPSEPLLLPSAGQGAAQL